MAKKLVAKRNYTAVTIDRESYELLTRMADEVSSEWGYRVSRSDIVRMGITALQTRRLRTRKGATK
jgi:Arc/MetJ-type ribon-helix-helix transcriptional regulator